MTPTILKTSELHGVKTRVVKFMPGVRDDKGVLVRYVPLKMSEARARQVASQMAKEGK